MVLVTFFSPDATSLLSFPVFLGVALALLLAMEIGYRIGRWHQKIGRGSIKEFVGIIDAPILALLGLLIGFTFFGAAERFERRRDLIVEETNHIGTAYLRLDLLRAEEGCAAHPFQDVP
jgi:glycopeptide antibiotics resistance protein